MKIKKEKLVETIEKVLRQKLMEESQITTAEELSAKLESVMKKHFPDSMIMVKFKSGIGDAIQIRFALAPDVSKTPNNIIQNDIAFTAVSIFGMNGKGDLETMLEFDPTVGGKIFVKPDPIKDKNMAYGAVKVGLAKKKGTPEQIIKHLDSYCVKLKKALKDNKENLTDDHKELYSDIIDRL